MSAATRDWPNEWSTWMSAHRVHRLSSQLCDAVEHLLMAFSTMVVLTTILVICVGHPANLVARRARDQEWRRIANHLCLAALCVCGALTLLTVLQPNGNWLPPAISLCSLAIGATFDVEGCRNEHSL